MVITKDTVITTRARPAAAVPPPSPSGVAVLPVVRAVPFRAAASAVPSPLPVVVVSKLRSARGGGGGGSGGNRLYKYSIKEINNRKVKRAKKKAN